MTGLKVMPIINILEGGWGVLFFRKFVNSALLPIHLAVGIEQIFITIKMRKIIVFFISSVLVLNSFTTTALAASILSKTKIHEMSNCFNLYENDFFSSDIY